MNKPDIIVSWPKNCDYPLWREFIRKNRARFNLILIVFTEANQGVDYMPFVKKAMEQDYVHCIENSEVLSGQDWRDVAVKQALIHSFNAEWVWFTEQDFYIKTPHFWETIQEYADKGIRAIGAMDSQRLHPCSLFVRRDLLNWLVKNFGANPPYYDHFGYIQEQLEANKEDVGVIPSAEYLHMNGLSHNWRLMAEGGKPNYRPEQFNMWLLECLQVDVPLNEGWVITAREYVAREKLA
jgi:hypothetical protein